MTIEYSLEGGRLVETETRTTGKSYTAERIDSAITTLTNQLVAKQADLDRWKERKAKLAEFQR